MAGPSGVGRVSGPSGRREWPLARHVMSRVYWFAAAFGDLFGDTPRNRWTKVDKARRKRPETARSRPLQWSRGFGRSLFRCDQRMVTTWDSLFKRFEGCFIGGRPYRNYLHWGHVTIRSMNGLSIVLSGAFRHGRDGGKTERTPTEEVDERAVFKLLGEHVQAEMSLGYFGALEPRSGRVSLFSA